MKNVVFILLATLVVVGCKKENKIEKNLWKKGGEWNITTWEEKETSSYFYQDNYTETYHDMGTFQFNKDGTGTMTIKEEDGLYKENITYKNTENTLTIYDEDGDGTVFDLDWKKNEFTIINKRVETFSDYDENNSPVTDVVTTSMKITCKKK